MDTKKVLNTPEQSEDGTVENPVVQPFVYPTEPAFDPPVVYPIEAPKDEPKPSAHTPKGEQSLKKVVAEPAPKGVQLKVEIVRDNDFFASNGQGEYFMFHKTGEYQNVKLGDIIRK